MTLLRNNLPDFYLDDALPFLEKAIQEEYEGYPLISEKLANVGDMPYGITQHSQVSSLGAAGKYGEGEEVPAGEIYAGYATTFKSENYGIMLRTSRQAIDHQRTDILSKNPRRLARAFASAQEISFAALYNNGFTTNQADGVPFFSTSHPLLTPGAGTSSNRMAVDSDLAIQALKDMATLFKQQLDTAGNLISITPKKLLVSSFDEWNALELVKSIMLPGGSTNNVNSMGPEGKYNFEVISGEYLTDTDAWFMGGDPVDTEVHWFWDLKPELKSEVEFKTEVLLTKMVARWCIGVSDWRGWCGTPGA